MKFGKVLTYRDIEKAKKLIGKKCLFSGEFYAITENPNSLATDCPENIGVLSDIHTDLETFYPFKLEEKKSTQFIREVIEDEPSYRPFKDVAELVEYWEKNYTDKKRPNGTMPFIWIKHKNNNLCFLITRYETNKNSVCVSESTQWFNLENLFEFYEFLDGSLCGVKE